MPDLKQIKIDDAKIGCNSLRHKALSLFQQHIEDYRVMLIPPAIDCGNTQQTGSERQGANSNTIGVTLLG